MPFCKNCGSPVEGQFCAKCGSPAAAPSAGFAPPPPPAGQAYSQPAGQAAAPAQAAVAAGGMTDNVAGLLCYVLGFITGILFLVLAPYNQNKFVRFHAFQSIFFNIAIFAVEVVLIIVGSIFAAISPIALGLLMGLIGMVVWLGVLVIWIILMVKAYGGQKFMLPIVGALADKQA